MKIKDNFGHGRENRWRVSKHIQNMCSLGQPGEPGTFVEEGVYVGQVGCRFDRVVYFAIYAEQCIVFLVLTFWYSFLEVLEGLERSGRLVG